MTIKNIFIEDKTLYNIVLFHSKIGEENKLKADF